MEGQPNGSLQERQDLVTHVTVMLQGIDRPEESMDSEQCIYRVPQKIRQSNKNAYTPCVVSIGPFHNPHLSGGDNSLETMEELKPKYLKGFLTRTELPVEELVLKLKEWETRIRSYYAEPINYSSDDFVRMILIDACFIIEHFLRFYAGDWFDRDPLLSKPWLTSDVSTDLILLENQLPFFVLEDICTLANVNLHLSSFLEITFTYFDGHNYQIIKPEGVSPKHFTDLLRIFLLPSSSVDLGTINSRIENNVEHLYSASQLLEAGLVFKASQSNCLLDLKYHDGVLEMPRFPLQDSTEIFIRNIVAFEQCHYPFSSFITDYIVILDLLIDTENDVKILVDKKIISNLLGDANAVATMINNICLNLTQTNFNSAYFALCNQLNNFYENPCNKYKAIFVHEYFNTPWKIASTVAAAVLLLLTFIQTVFSIIK